ncbi:MAG: YidC/Oxa1 family insertase periplasmic-domain containing protein, partial [Phycisphaerales bacterium]
QITRPAPAPTPTQQPETEMAAAPAQSPPPPEPAGREPAASTPPVPAADTDETEAATPPAPATPNVPAPTGLRVRTVERVDALSRLGSTDPDGPWNFEVAFTPYGGGVESIVFADYFESVDKQQHYAVQERKSAGGVAVVSLAAVGLELSVGDEPGVFLDLRRPASGSGALWREIGPGEFEAVIEDEGGDPVARVRKAYTLREGSFEIGVEQTFENLTALPMRVTWYQYGPVDLPPETSGIPMDTRRFRFGYVLPPSRDPGQYVYADNDLLSLTALIKRERLNTEPIWPREADLKAQRDLSWIAMTSRYFAFVVHPPLDPDNIGAGGQPVDKTLDLAERVDRVVIGMQGDPNQSVVLQMTSAAMQVAPGGSLDLSFGAYAGPESKPLMRSEPVTNALNLAEMVVYNIGGMCAPCTFQWLAAPLLWFLRIAHNYLVFDWALAIILLVLVVRTILHPITRRSQIAMARFGKQMQGLAPKQKKLQEKYKDDPKRLQQEMAKLMREEGVNFTGALGCLPMFLQTPVWIALYAMLYFAFDLRHEPAFFGLFQTLTNGQWNFLADLSAPDHFIEFGRGYNVPILSGFLGPVTGVNILPLLLGVVFFIQQKYLTPPTTATMTPEQQTQQRIIKVMMVIMFPLFVFNAPSGLTLYFVTNSTLGILESRWIRSHINTLDLEKKPTRPAGRKKVANTAQSPFGRRAAEPKKPSFK